MATLRSYFFGNSDLGRNLPFALQDAAARHWPTPTKIVVNSKLVAAAQQITPIKIEGSGGCLTSEVWLCLTATEKTAASS